MQSDTLAEDGEPAACAEETGCAEYEVQYADGPLDTSQAQNNADARDDSTVDGTKQQTDMYKANGNVTVETSTTTTTTDSNGNRVTTVTNTQASFSTKKGHEGAFLGAQQTTYSISHTAQGAVVPGSLNSSQHNLTLAQATNVLGSHAIASATEATAPGFGGELSRDMQVHPIQYLLHFAGLVGGEAFELPSEVKAIITAVHAIHTAIDLEKENGGSQLTRMAQNVGRIGSSQGQNTLRGLGGDGFFSPSRLLCCSIPSWFPFMEAGIRVDLEPVCFF